MPTDFSILPMFINADIVVQLVMVSLIAASFWCWSILFSKYFAFKRFESSTSEFESQFWESKSLKKLYDTVEGDDPMSVSFVTTMDEAKKLRKYYSGTEFHHRLERVVTTTINREMDTLESNTSFLATVGSTAPFIGLFGTVWGIMHSFQSIAEMQSTNLAVVAPGIAEALLATALGLIAAIPATMGYNKIQNELARYHTRLDSFAQELVTLIGFEASKKAA